MGLTLLVGCRESPRWLDLASIDHSNQQHDVLEYDLAEGRKARVLAQNGGLRLEQTLSAADWKRGPKAGVWISQSMISGARNSDPMAFELVSGTRRFTPAALWKGLRRPSGANTIGTFQVTWRGVLIRLAEGEPPPAEAILSMPLEDDQRGTGRAWGRRFSGRGFRIWPGQSLGMVVDVPAASVLRFCTTLEPMVSAQGLAPTVFRILQDGRSVFEHAALDPSQAAQAWHSVPLAKAERSELTFTIEGSLANACFLAPVLGPTEVGTPGRRPWGDSPPDVMLFLADTFRADNLAAYGGDPRLTPNMDRLAAEGLVFKRAWSVGTYTLPTHATMFTGLMPYQAGLRSFKTGTPQGLETIAEALEAAGYRTGAITDAGVVSRRFAFDQGFAYFDEQRIDIDSTVERALAFLDADDGRPTFLFVHSYRAHVPYKVSERTRLESGAYLGVEGDYHELWARLTALAGQRGVRVTNSKFPAEFLGTDEALAILADLRAHYLGGVVDLDRGFGEFRSGLDQRGWFENGRLLFTSDHGEAFGEHGEVRHGQKVFETKIRIPLFLAGAGIPVGESSLAASLLDVAPTIADLAGIPRRQAWSGQALLTLAHDRAVYSFGFDDDSTFSVIEGPHKVIGFQTDGLVERDRILGCFDLDRDPAESEDAARTGASWPAEMLERHLLGVEQALVPSVETNFVELDASDLEELDQLGYGQGLSDE